MRANPGVDPWLPGEGREVVVPTQFVLPNAPREGLVINVAAMRVYYFPPKVVNGKKVPRKPGEAQVVYTHPIGIGKVGWSTPEGTTQIIAKQKDPVWRPTASIRKEHQENGEDLPALVPAGPDNPLGKLQVHPGLADIPDPRHEQALWRRPALQPWLHPPLPGGHPDFLRDDSHRYAGARGEPAVHIRLARGQLYLQALTVLEDDPRDWKTGQKKLLQKTFTPRIQKELKAHNETVNWDIVARISHDRVACRCRFPRREPP